ncbi:MAG: hypothetical protein U0744_21445 [Gemmataceae bacterium]
MAAFLRNAACRLPAIVVGAFLLVSIGCSRGPTPMKVWGDVTYQGKPVEEGDIVFVSTGGPGRDAGATIAGGKYEVPRDIGPYADGSYRVEIKERRKTGKKLPHPFNPALGPVDEYVFPTPAKYGTRSALTIKVSSNSSENKHDFHLK